MGTAGGVDAAGGPGALGGSGAAGGSGVAGGLGTAGGMGTAGGVDAAGGPGALGGSGAAGGSGGDTSASSSALLTAVPHERQNLASASRSEAHPGHAFTSGENAFGRWVKSRAHAPHACDPGATAAPQDGQ